MTTTRLMKTEPKKSYHLVRLTFVFICTVLCTIEVNAQTIKFNGEKSTWHEGFDRYDFIMDTLSLAITPFKAPAGEGFGIGDPPAGHRRCVIIVPKNAAPGNPWSWRGCYWDHQPQTEVELLKRGFYIAYISSGATLRPGKEWDAWYKFLTEHGLSAKPAFIGMSRGGEFEYIWATNHPDKVSGIYADNPLGTHDILMKLGNLARYDVPLLHICGSFDPLFSTGTMPIENIYQQFGGRVSVMIKEGFGHHPHSLHNPKIIADFIEQSFNEKENSNPAFAGSAPVKTAFYGVNNTYQYFPDESAFITCRGAFFTACYNRYMMQVTGVESFINVIAPKRPAPGNPWLFRPEYVKRDDTTSMALLAKGYYIVTGAVPYNADGPVMEQWNKIYNYLIGYGFSKKAVMAGSGGGAGEAVAWAIGNPDKVTCIYAENPILKSKAMSKVPPLDNLAPLAKAGIPVLFICGSLDPYINDQAREAEKRYKKLGGKITLMIKNAQGHFLSDIDPKPAVTFVSSYDNNK